jgi:cation:H+ antiporter
MVLQILALVALFAPLALSASAFVDGASALSRRLGVSPLVVGLTVVAFGTSAPELVVNVFASVEGSSGIVLGNVVGSNLFNSLVILGVAGIIIPFDVNRRATRVELPLGLLAALVLVAMAADPFLDGAPARLIGRSDALLALGLFGVFVYTLYDTMRAGAPGVEAPDVEAPWVEPPDIGVPGLSPAGPRGSGARAVAREIGKLTAGLAVLLVSARLIVVLATGVAAGFGVPDRIIGLTVVSVGTSLPELVTSATAAIRREIDIAVGNVLGSNIFNVLLILATSAVICPVPVSDDGMADLFAHFAASVLVLLFVRAGGGRRVNRVEAVLLICSYGAYIAYSLTRA